MPEGTIRPPAAKGHWFWGSLLERRDDPLRLFTRMHAELGETVEYKMGPWITVLSITHPDHVKHVLVDSAGKYYKGKGIDRMRPLLGEGLLTSEGSFWMRQRRLATPAFHKNRVAGFARTMVEATQELIARWTPGQPIDVAHEMMRLALTIVSRTLFSSDVSNDVEQIGEALTVAMEETNRRMLRYFVMPDFVPTKKNRELRAALETLNGIVFRLIADRRAGRTQGDDLLGMLIAAKDADTGEQMNDQQLRDEVMTLFLAGHETTANALSWLWFALSRHPEVRERVEREVDEVLQGRAPGAEDMQRLKYLGWTLNETMRLHPPAWIMARQPLEEDSIGGIPVPKSSRIFVMMAPWVIHRNPRIWPDPERFDPERFSPEQVAARPKLAYIPFGAGQRMCIGYVFALMEATLAAAVIAQRFRLDLVPGQRVEAEPLITLRPKHGIQMIPTVHPERRTQANPERRRTAP